MGGKSRADERGDATKIDETVCTCSPKRARSLIDKSLAEIRNTRVTVVNGLTSEMVSGNRRAQREAVKDIAMVSRRVPET